jgi:hypothetical protein
VKSEIGFGLNHLLEWGELGVAGKHSQLIHWTANEGKARTSKMAGENTNLFNFFDALESPLPSNARFRSPIVATKTRRVVVDGGAG